jgi:hypothetical protein
MAPLALTRLAQGRHGVPLAQVVSLVPQAGMRGRTAILPARWRLERHMNSPSLASLRSTAARIVSACPSTSPLPRSLESALVECNGKGQRRDGS